VEHTPDGRYVVVDGRRWRATDPLVPEDVGAELRRALMSARRAVGAALRSSDPVAERVARARVHAAKVALGERGTPWWEQSEAERRARWETEVVEPGPPADHTDLPAESGIS
jgi:hypothetical protein